MQFKTTDQRQEREELLRNLDERLAAFNKQLAEAPPSAQLKLQKEYLRLDELRQRVLKNLALEPVEDKASLEKADKYIGQLKDRLAAILN